VRLVLREESERNRSRSTKWYGVERMKVLLCEDVKRLGWLGDIVEVAEGYARNYLLPQGLATVATQGNIRALAEEKAKRAEERVKERKRLEAAAEAVEGAEAVLAALANEHGVLFGSITDRQIAANLREQGFLVADEVVKLPEHIKQVGTHNVTLRFAEDVTATVNVVVVAEQTGEQKDESGEETEKQEAEPAS
jgi:large subunit ribosomal protein L9